jgi:hypothetical protein
VAAAMANVDTEAGVVKIINSTISANMRRVGRRWPVQWRYVADDTYERYDYRK